MKNDRIEIADDELDRVSGGLIDVKGKGSEQTGLGPGSSYLDINGKDSSNDPGELVFPSSSGLEEPGDVGRRTGLRPIVGDN